MVPCKYRGHKLCVIKSSCDEKNEQLHHAVNSNVADK